MKNLINLNIKKNVRSDIHDIKNLKAFLDEYLNDFLKEKRHKQDFYYDNIKIGIGLVSVVLASAISIVSSLYDYLEIETFLFVSVLFYYAINGLYYAVEYLQNSKYYYKKFDIRTVADDSGEYMVIIYYKDNKKIPKKYNRSVFELFYDTGKMDYEAFDKDLEELFKE